MTVSRGKSIHTGQPRYEHGKALRLVRAVAEASVGVEPPASMGGLDGLLRALDPTLAPTYPDFMSVGTGSRSWWSFALLLLFGVFGCAPGLGGQASFPVVSKANIPSGFEKVAEVDEQRCSYGVLLFWAWGDDANHEALVTDILEKYKGDAIANAELTFFYIPAVLYNQSCAVVKGTVVRRSSSAPPAPDSGPQKEASR
jgi:hypothetical protein